MTQFQENPRTDGRMDRSMDGRTDEKKDGRKDGWGPNFACLRFNIVLKLIRSQKFFQHIR